MIDLQRSLLKGLKRNLLNIKEMIWYDNIFLFFQNEQNWFKIVPNPNTTVEEQLNAIFMFAVYFTIGVLVIKRDIRIIYVFLLICILTWLFHRNLKKEGFQQSELEKKCNIEKQKYQDTYCVKPQKHNPFMNVMMKDINEFPNRPKACRLTNKNIADQANRIFDENLSREISDVFHKNASDRQFYTNPVTTIPNDLDGFKDFVYKIPPTLKQQGQNF